MRIQLFNNFSKICIYFEKGGTGGPTKHRKELQDTENSAKNYKVLQGTTRYFQTKHKVAENTTRNYKILSNEAQSS